MRPMIHASIALGMVATAAYWLLIGPKTAVAVTIAVGLTYMTATLIQLELAARACPPEAVGTAFALLMSLENLASAGSTWVGGRFYGWGTGLLGPDGDLPRAGRDRGAHDGFLLAARAATSHGRGRALSDAHASDLRNAPEAPGKPDPSWRDISRRGGKVEQSARGSCTIHASSGPPLRSRTSLMTRCFLAAALVSTLAVPAPRRTRSRPTPPL